MSTAAFPYFVLVTGFGGGGLGGCDGIDGGGGIGFEF
jgi:hypothetical protein